MKTIFLLTIIALAQTMTYSLNEIKSMPDSAQFDFWVGSWSLEWKDSEGKIKTGTNNVLKIMDGYTVHENFEDGDGIFKGMSVSVYNHNLSKWQQTWVDNAGEYMDFTGGMNGDKMILSREFKNKKGETVQTRMIFYNIAKDEFNWNWEKSTDNGTSWTVLWQIHYRRNI